MIKNFKFWIVFRHSHSIGHFQLASKRKNNFRVVEWLIFLPCKFGPKMILEWKNVVDFVVMQNKDWVPKFLEIDICLIATLPRRAPGSFIKMRTKKLTGLSGVFALDFFNRIQEIVAESEWLVKAWVMQDIFSDDVYGTLFFTTTTSVCRGPICLVWMKQQRRGLIELILIVDKRW